MYWNRAASVTYKESAVTHLGQQLFMQWRKWLTKEWPDHNALLQQQTHLLHALTKEIKQWLNRLGKHHPCMTHSAESSTALWPKKKSVSRHKKTKRHPTSKNTSLQCSDRHQRQSRNWCQTAETDMKHIAETNVEVPSAGCFQTETSQTQKSITKSCRQPQTPPMQRFSEQLKPHLSTKPRHSILGK